MVSVLDILCGIGAYICALLGSWALASAAGHMIHYHVMLARIAKEDLGGGDSKEGFILEDPEIKRSLRVIIMSAVISLSMAPLMFSLAWYLIWGVG